MPRVVGVVPAAGLASRLQPLNGSKELVEVGGRPVLDYLVERLRAAPCEEIRLVTRPEKQDVIQRAGELGLTVVEALPETAAASVAAGLADLASEDLALLGFPDTIWQPVEGFARLLAELGSDHDAVLGVFTSREPERSDVVEIVDGVVHAVHIKVSPPPGNAIWGIAAARRGALDGLEEDDELGRRFDRLARSGSVRAVVFPGEFVDIGTAEALERAREQLG